MLLLRKSFYPNKGNNALLAHKSELKFATKTQLCLHLRRQSGRLCTMQLEQKLHAITPYFCCILYDTKIIFTQKTIKHLTTHL